MTLHYIDGFEDTVSTVSRWSSKPTVTSPGRFGVGSCAGSSLGGMYLIFPDTSDLIVGVAIKPNIFKDTIWWIGVGNSDGVQNTIACGQNTSEFALLRGASSVLAGGTKIITKSSGIAAGNWYYVEFRLTLNDTGGTATMWVDGAQAGTFTGDTRQSGTQTIYNRLYIGSDDGWGGYIDDVYVVSADATAPNTNLGDSRVTTLFPNGNGTTSGGTGSDGNSTDNYALVDETTYNSADYVDFPTTVKDTYAYSDASLNSGATIHGIQVASYIAKTDVGSITAKPVVRSGGTEVDGTAVTPTSTTAVEFDEVFVTKPGGGAWTASTIDAAEFGLKGE